MSRPRFIADHDFNEHIIRGVQRREPSIEFIKVRDVGLGAAADAEILDYAATESWIVVSHDVTTMSAAANVRMISGQPMNGLLLVHQLSPLAPVIDSLILIWSASDMEDWANQIGFLPL